MGPIAIFLILIFFFTLISKRVEKTILTAPIIFTLGGRGVYLIFDESDQKAYVGAAYGKENILGRWLNYAKAGHGGNKKLRHRDPSSFRFSILQRVSPDMDAEDVIRFEGTWKDRLHTRDFGLNEN